MRKSLKYFLLLQLDLLLLSFTGVLSKCAAGNEFLSASWIIFYLFMLCVLGVYAIFWQQIIKHLPLTVAFTCKAITIVWSMIWGIVIFGEVINIWKMLGASIVIFGVVIFVRAGGDHLRPDKPEESLTGDAK